jgi:hypothetical protein
LLFNTVIAQINSAARYEIDAKRIGVAPTDKDALPRSREFIRLDSTYYVGHMFEGLYKFERSADYLGYKFASVPLRKAFDLLSKDYGDRLRNLYSSPLYYSQYQNRMSDLYQIAYALQNCYNSIEMPDSSMILLDRLEKFHFQKDFFSVYNERAWIYHRNRFFTSEKFKFLKNSVEENEEMAFRCCKFQLELIARNKDINDYWFGPDQSRDDVLGVEHNLALLHCYNTNYDSAEYYYQRLIEGNRILWGNYASMQHELGNIDSSIMYYSMPQNAREHALSEPDYYLPSLYIYGARTKEAIEMVRNKIDESGSTPGFGWYNIALARSYLYDGQLDSTEFFLDKASNFRELHLHTTLTQSQYEFTINLLRVQLLDRKIDQVKFLNKGWWYSVGDLYDMLSLKIEKLMTEYVVVNELASNPERQRIVYDLFCGESTVTYDEIMYLMRDFNSGYFKNRCNYSKEHDKRVTVKKYFTLAAAQLKLENGDEEDALKEAMQLEGSLGPDENYLLDTANEKLFQARMFEVLAKASSNEDDSKKARYANSLLEKFPQLLPFSGIKMKMKLTVAGDSDEISKEVLEELKDCNIEWAENNETNIPEVNILFRKKGKNYQVFFNVKSGNGINIVPEGRMVFKEAEGTGKELALRLFGKGGGLEYEAGNGQQEKLP